MSPSRGAGCLGRLTSLLAGANALVVLVSVAEGYEPRSYDGTDNNLAEPSWGSVGSTQIRAVAGADYDDAAFTPPGSDRPSAREVMTDVFLASKPAVSTRSAMFVAWGQMLMFDMSLTADNSSESFDVPCDDGNGRVDTWCPLGASSEDISFNRSDAAVADSVRSPTNYATAFIDLDYLYGRSEEEADALRTFEGGLMNLTDSGVPFRNEDGTWLMADQRPAKLPVTFALHIVLLLEHNRCCVDVAPDLGYEGDEELYQACRAWTIALFQHITENDYYILLIGSALADIDRGTSARRRLGNRRGADNEDKMRTREAVGSEVTGGQDQKQPVTVAALLEGSGALDDAFSQGTMGEFVPGQAERERTLVGEGSTGTASRPLPRQRQLYTLDDYREGVNPGADVFTLTAGAAALESTLPPIIRIVSEGYLSVDDDNIELIVAAEDIAGLFERNGVGNILRGAVLSPALAVDTYYTAAVSNLSPLFKLPVDAVQRGRDHGLPTYNDAREAYNLTAVTTFSEITPDAKVCSLLSSAYGGDIDNVDAISGGLAEAAAAGTGSIFGELLQAAWAEQALRSFESDRLHHLHSRKIEDLQGTTLSAVIERTVGVSDLPLATFTSPGVSVCGGECESIAVGNATLSDSFGVAWEEDGDMVSISLRAKGIGTSGMLGVGFGGLTMYDATDYIICLVTSEDVAVCTDRSAVSSRKIPDLDDEEDPEFEVTDILVGADWTTVTFKREKTPADKLDYDLGKDIDAGSTPTSIIYSFKEGGIGQHTNANRGFAKVDFATGAAVTDCDDSSQYVSLHGALMLVAWLVLVPMGIYYIRYRKGENVAWAGREWWEMHEEIMIVAAEAVLPLGITAVFASGGNHDTSHAYWGYYLIAAVAMQVISGWVRVKALEAKQANYSYFHRFNKFFHIYSGRFAYLAGVAQCYRGLELVSADDNLLLSAGEGLDLELGTFGWVQNYLFFIWCSFLGLCFLYFETRKQYHRYFKKGSANMLGCLKLVNEGHDANVHGAAKRLMPRTEDLPLYTVTEFNDKVLNGQSWVLVDGAILDVSSFSHRHPGGARLVLNALGTDITHELLGEELSVGHVMAFTPHTHPESAWELARSLVIGYIEEEDEEDEEEKKNPQQSTWAAASTDFRLQLTLAPFRKAVLQSGNLGQSVSNPISLKAARLNELAAIPDERTPAEDLQDQEPFRTLPKMSWSSSKRLLERFHVCPLLFRERMGAASALGRGNLRTARPVYRYIFSCPGQAQALVEAMTGVGHFNMRATPEGKGVIQRAYNAFAVRVLDPELGTPAGGVKRRGGKGAAAREVVPAGQTTEGTLCIEMRIRLYPDGAMSKVLEKLANDPDNPVVQLQGPFLIQKLTPPPAHRNVVMIAAGTGVNPMVQQIRDYMAHNRDAMQASRSRMVLLWQSTAEADLYGSEEITRMQAESNGLLEVTVLISGDQRKRNFPGAAFRKAKEKLNAARRVISPMFVSPASSIASMLPLRHEISISVDMSQASHQSTVINGNDREEEIEEEGTKESSHQADAESPTTTVVLPDEGWKHPVVPPSLVGHSSVQETPQQQLKKATVHRPRERSVPSRRLDMVDVTGGSIDKSKFEEVTDLARGKVNREVLEQVFGESMLTALAAYNELSVSRFATSRRLAQVSERKGSGSDGGGDGYDDAMDDARNDLCGSDSTAGRLQVVVSGPSGFVFYVESILVDMGVPRDAMVLLD